MLTAKQYVVKPEISPDLRAHGAIFEQKIYKVGDNVYSAVGWSICNTIMVVGSHGVVIVDTGTDAAGAESLEWLQRRENLVVCGRAQRGRLR